MAFFIASAKARFWRHVYENFDEAIEQAGSYRGGDYANVVRDSVSLGVRESLDLPIPDGYSFQIDGKLAKPL